MLVIIQTENYIKVIEQEPSNEEVILNNQNLNSDQFKIKTVTNSGVEVKIVQTENFKFNILNNKIFGKTKNNQRFKGGFNENLNFFDPIVQQSVYDGTIKMCGHDH